MPYGSELIFKLDDSTLERLFDEYVKEHPGEPYDDPSQRYMMLCAADDLVSAQLKEVHRRLLQERFGNVKDASGPTSSTFLVNTPEGRREFWPLHVGGYGYEDEAEEHIGISIAGRYFPIWVDWRSPHGGGDQVIFNPETLEMAEQARAAIAEVIPEVKDAPLMTVLNWY